MGKLNTKHDPLTQRGHAQAERVAAELATEAVAAVYASTLPRTIDTATPIARQFSLPVVTDPRIVELDFGNGGKSGLGSPGIIKDAELAGVPALTYTGHGGESFSQVIVRARPFFQELVEKHHGQTVVVVAHGALIRAMLYDLLNLSELTKLGHANTAYSILSVAEDGTYRPHVIAEKRHIT